MQEFAAFFNNCFAKSQKVFLPNRKNLEFPRILQVIFLADK